MTISATILALQARHALLSGVTSAPAFYPSSLAASDLPLALTDAAKGKTDWESHGGDYEQSVRTYRVRVFVLPTSQGQGIDEGKQKAITLLDTFLTSYGTTPGVTSTATIMIERGIEDSGVLGDPGTAPLTYAETTYYGFTMLLPVEERTG